MSQPGLAGIASRPCHRLTIAERLNQAWAHWNHRVSPYVERFEKRIGRLNTPSLDQILADRQSRSSPTQRTSAAARHAHNLEQFAANSKQK